jgi:hypothetical protein
MQHGQQNIIRRCSTVSKTLYQDAARSAKHYTEMQHGQHNIKIPKAGSNIFLTVTILYKIKIVLKNLDASELSAFIWRKSSNL